MSSGSSPAYQLRPNKAVDRELFLALLARVAGGLVIEKYKYIGLGGPFLEDFRLLHARLGITDMVCIEQEEAVLLRQKFNRPFASVKCLHSTIEDYFAGTEFEEPVILWLDYTEPMSLRKQIECFCTQVCTLPVGSIVKLTLNANPTSLGTPGRHEMRKDVFGASSDGKPTLHEWRLARLRERLGEFVPVELSPTRLTKSKFGGALLEIVELALDRAIEGYTDRKPNWCLATIYADGQAMTTTTIFIGDTESYGTNQAISSWPFYSTPSMPHVLDLPALSTRERLTMEASKNPRSCFEYKLPKSDLKQDPFKTFRSFYRVYPQFARVDI